MLMSLANLHSEVYESNHYKSFPELHGAYLGQTPPGNVPEIFCSGFLKPPDGFHSSISFSPDMEEVYWTSMGAHTFCSKLNNGVWTLPVEMRFTGSLRL